MVYPYSPLALSLKYHLEYDATVSKRVKSFLTLIPLFYFTVDTSYLILMVMRLSLRLS